MRLKPLLLVLLVLSFLAPLLGITAKTLAQGPQDPTEAIHLQDDSRITKLLNQMSPLEKVGQLMLITFDGTDTSENTKIAQLIR